MRRGIKHMVAIEEQNRAERLVLREADIQRTICDFLRAEQWRVFEFENEWSERKKKLLGEEGMPDVLAIRYFPLARDADHNPIIKPLWAETLWIECKRIDKRGRLTKPTQAQKDWKLLEQKRGALIITLGEECPATIEGWIGWYKGAGLRRR